MSKSVGILNVSTAVPVITKPFVSCVCVYILVFDPVFGFVIFALCSVSF